MQILAQQLDGSRPLAERQRALSVLVDVATGPLRGFLQRRLPYAYWEDVIAETWLIVTHKIHQGAYLAERGDPVAYVLGIATNVVRRAAATDGPVDLAEQEVVDERTPFAESEARMLVQQAAATLTHPEDQAVLEAILHERSISDMAIDFGCSYKTAWRRYHRCLAQCRAALNHATEGGILGAIGA